MRQKEVDRELKQLERERIDREFEEMGNDAEYRALMIRMDRELAPISDDAWRIMDEQERNE